jgi:hypothetical protein
VNFLAGLAGTMAAILLFTGVSAGGGQVGGEDSRTDAGLMLLRDLREQLQDAEDHGNKLSVKFEHLMDEAQAHRRLFVLVALSDYSYLDECDAAILIRRLSEVDSAVARGYYEQGADRHFSLMSALTDAREVADMINECAPESFAFADVTLGVVRRLFQNHEDGKVRDARSQRVYLTLRQSIRNRNRSLIDSAPDKVKGGCLVPTIDRQVSDLGVLVAVARTITPGYFLEFRTARDGQERHEAEEKARKGRRALVVRAQEETNKLIREWRSCSVPLCADARDNDGDGSADAADLGCQTGAGGRYDPDDQGEEDAGHGTRVLCDIDPASTGPRTFRDFSVNSGDELVGFNLRNVTSGELIFAKGVEVDPDFAAGGPFSLGASVCGPGTATTVSWRVEEVGIIWDYAVTKVEGVMPQPQPIVASGSTR